jgi:hypothetical protein
VPTTNAPAGRVGVEVLRHAPACRYGKPEGSECSPALLANAILFGLQWVATPPTPVQSRGSASGSRRGRKHPVHPARHRLWGPGRRKHLQYVAVKPGQSGSMEHEPTIVGARRSHAHWPSCVAELCSAGLTGSLFFSPIKAATSLKVQFIWPQSITPA